MVTGEPGRLVGPCGRVHEPDRGFIGRSDADNRAKFDIKLCAKLFQCGNDFLAFVDADDHLVMETLILHKDRNTVFQIKMF